MIDDNGSIWICTEIWHNPIFRALDTDNHASQIVFLATLSSTDYPSGEVDYERLTQYARLPKLKLDRCLDAFVRHGLVEVRDGKHFVVRHDDMYILDPNFVPPEDDDSEQE